MIQVIEGRNGILIDNEYGLLDVNGERAKGQATNENPLQLPLSSLNILIK